MNFEEWLHCYTMTLTPSRGGANGPTIRRCYLQGQCDDIDIAPGWYDCYWHGKCDVPHPDTIDQTPCLTDLHSPNLDHYNDFYRWLECHTGGVPACKDTGGKFKDCYLQNSMNLEFFKE